MFAVRCEGCHTETYLTVVQIKEEYHSNVESIVGSKPRGERSLVELSRLATSVCCGENHSAFMKLTPGPLH